MGVHFDKGQQVTVMPGTFERLTQYNGKKGVITGKKSMCDRLYEVKFKDGETCFVLPHNLLREE